MQRGNRSWGIFIAFLAGLAVGVWAGFALKEVRTGVESETKEGGLNTSAVESTSFPLESKPQLASSPEDAGPKDPLQLMDKRLAEGRYDAALGLAEYLLEMRQHDRERLVSSVHKAVNGLVSQALDQGKPDRALHWLERGFELIGETGELLYHYGTVHRAVGDNVNARYYFERAGRFDSAYLVQSQQAVREMTLEKTQGLAAAGQTETAVALLVQATREDASYAEYHRVLGELQLKLGDLESSRHSFEQALMLGGERYSKLGQMVSELERRLADEDAIRVPFEVRHGVMYVDVGLNGRPQAFRFILDTGASHTAISSRVAKDLGIRIPAGSPRVRVNTANGSALALPTILASVELGEARLIDVPALIIDGLEQADGLLGLSYLQRFQMEIRQEAGYVALRPR